jgi:two-component system, NtrC family, response regulator AtoC
MEYRGVQVLECVKGEIASKVDGAHFVETVSPAMRGVELAVSHVAATDFPVLLMGESGSGKEAIALHIHRRSPRASEPFTKVACGALTPESFEALRREFELNNRGNGNSKHGTLFLDEITDLVPGCQAALVHALPDEELAADGPAFGARMISCTVRTPLQLEELLERGVLRKDLFYRINGVCLRLPPLRERKEDIPVFIEYFLRKNSSFLARPIPSLSARLLQSLQEYSWPGNIRELENAVKKIVALGNVSEVTEWGAFASSAKNPDGNDEKLSLKEAGRAASRQAERELILKVLERTHWNRKRAARQLQISYKALLYKLRQTGLDKTEAT